MNKKLIGQYKLIKKIATGGMGEIYLAYDPQCKRNIVIKKIKKEIQEKPNIQQRFLQETTITNKLAHPYIIPIYSVNMQKELYYTMPYIEDAQTLHQLINSINTGQQSYDLQSMIRIFLNICEVIAYAHSKNILHQDIKPDNILIGKYGQLFLLDWGIAIFNNNAQKAKKRISGTLNFLAPERVNGSFPSIKTEIYSLGVLLYQMLTLEVPFKQRTSLLSFKKNFKKERLKDPIEVAPNREIPFMLNEITKKCLKVSPIERYNDVNDLIKDLKDFINGNPKWVLIHEMDIKNENNWQINDPILLSKHTAISANINLSEWLIAKIAKLHLYENLKIDLKIKFTADTNGLGIIFSIPDIRHSTSIKSSYCLWVSTLNSKFLRSFVLIKQLNVKLEKNIIYDIKIEKNR